MNPLTFIVDRTKLQNAKHEWDELQLVKQWLLQNGYEVSQGQKLCRSAFDENNTAKRKDDLGMREGYGVGMEVVDAMNDSLDVMSLMFSILVATKSDELMHQLERYYRELGLIAKNGQPKTFLTHTRAKGKTHKSNIAMMQVNALRSHFERLQVVSDIKAVPCSKLGDEHEVEKVLKEARCEQLQLIKTTPEKLSSWFIGCTFGIVTSWH